MPEIRYAVVIPVNNEEDAVEPLMDALRRVMDALGTAYEVIVVDDGSSDHTLPRLQRCAQQFSRLTIISFAVQQGKGAALQAAMDRSRGEVLVTLDGDLQDDPTDIPRLLQKLEEGYDVVCGWRFPRYDPWLKKASSMAANLVRRILLRERVHDVGCGLRVFRRAVLDRVEFAEGKHRWFTWLAAREGFRIGEVKVHHRPRSFGHSHYGIWDRLIESCFTLWRLRKPTGCDHESAVDRDSRKS